MTMQVAQRYTSVLSDATRLQPIQPIPSAIEQMERVLIATSRPMLIGRSPICDIVIAHPTVSREQAIVFYENEQFWLRNLSRHVPIRSDLSQTLRFQQQCQLGKQTCLCIGRVQLHVATVKPQYAVGQVVCSNCETKQDVTLHNCMWCGTSLAFGRIYT